MPVSSAQQAFDTTVGEVRDPWSALAKLRREVGVSEGGVVPDAGAGAEKDGRRFAVLRYDDCARVLRDDVTFSSRVYERVMGPVMGHTILEMDAPDHGRFRKLAGHAFRHKALLRWESELIQPLAEETIARFAPRGHAELVSELTFPFPVQVIARILGLPHVDYPMFQQLAFTLTSVGAGYRASREASDRLAEYLTPIVDDRRAHPADDLISELAAAEIDGETLTDEEIVSYLRLLLPAGSETTYCSIGNLVFALLSHAEQLEAVRRDGALLPRAIEELLRWEPPIPFIPRLATADVVVAGVAIPAGARVTVCLGAANRDETRFADPDRFDIRRPERQQLAFASGPHMCLGMHLARMEMRVVIEALLDRFPDLRLAPGPDGSNTSDPHIQGLGFRKPNCLPVRFSPCP